MNLTQVKLKNFRRYLEEISIDFTNLTVFVGKNDVGKSTVLEALEIFFNNKTVKIDPLVVIPEVSDSHSGKFRTPCSPLFRSS